MTKPQEQKKVGPITHNMIIYNIVAEYPETMEVFYDYGIHCVGCGMSMYETIEQGAKVHGINPDDLIEDLNYILTV